MTTVIIVLIILLTLAHFYLNCSLMTSLATFVSALFAGVAALSYYEAVADLFIARGYAGQWAPVGAYVLLFVLAFTLFRTLADSLIGAKVDLGQRAKVIAAVSCGILTGMLIAGNVLIAVGLLPFQNKLLYSRFPDPQALAARRPSEPLLNPDGIVAGLYSWFSRGALASDRSFAVVQADFLNKNHINRFFIAEDVSAIASRKCLMLPPKTKKPLRVWKFPDSGPVVVLRVGVVHKSIVDGGAAGDDGQLRFALGQMRLICKAAEDADNLRGKGTALLPVGFLKNGQLTMVKLDELLDDRSEHLLGTHNRVVWMDVAFRQEGAQGQKPVAFQFKQNAMVSLIGIPLEETSAELEINLNTSGDGQPQPSD